MATAAFAQSTPQVSGLRVSAGMIGRCSITIDVPAAPGRATAYVELNGILLRTSAEVTSPSGKYGLKGPLQQGDQIRVRAATEGENQWSPIFHVTPAPNDRIECGPSSDEREAFEALIYYGEVFDNFAPAIVGGYDPELSKDASETQHRWMAGVDFAYRVLGRKGDKRQLWLFGETMHGIRSADVDCTGEKGPAPPVCSDTAGQSQKVLYVLKHASSLEGYGGAKLELWTAQRGSDAEAKLYATARFGFLGLSGGSRVYVAHHVGGGLQFVSGPFESSYVEVGWGRSDMFLDDDKVRGRWNRLKLDALLSFELPGITKWTGGTYGFVQLYLDNRIGDKSSDSIQTFIGVTFDPRNLFKGW